LNTKSCLYPNDPLWFSQQLHSRLTISNQAASWINETGSITQRLRKQYGNNVRVQVLHSQWQKSFLSESRLLNTQPKLYHLTREVLLSVDETPLVLARTIIPKKTLLSAQQQLSHLGNRPLGEVIFSYPKLTRTSLEVSHIPQQHWHPETQKKADIHQDLWGRRTIYSLNQHPLLVSEFFLASIL